MNLRSVPIPPRPKNEDSPDRKGDPFLRHNVSSMMNFRSQKGPTTSATWNTLVDHSVLNLEWTCSFRSDTVRGEFPHDGTRVIRIIAQASLSSQLSDHCWLNASTRRLFFILFRNCGGTVLPSNMQSEKSGPDVAISAGTLLELVSMLFHDLFRHLYAPLD